MNPVNGKIIVRVNRCQKNTLTIGGNTLHTATDFDTNYREKSPTVAVVVEGNNYVSPGDFLLCHHNLFYLPSPYHIEDDLFSIPFSKVLFAKIDMLGGISPICGNMLCERVDIETTLSMPEKKQYLDRVVVLDGGGTMYKKGQLVFTRPYSFYQIIWNWNGEEKRTHKCDSDMVVGLVK